MATHIGLTEEVPDQQSITFPEWAFCVAYQIRDADDRDARPVDPHGEKDPFNDKDTRIPYGLINERNIVDVAALSTRIVKSKVLSKQSANEVIRGTTQGAEQHPVMECYEPHHIFIFYAYEGHPVGAIEVCFSCNRVKMNPEVRIGGGRGSLETADLAGLAKIAFAAGLDLKPFASVHAYVQRLDQVEKRIMKMQNKSEMATPRKPSD